MPSNQYLKLRMDLQALEQAWEKRVLAEFSHVSGPYAPPRPLDLERVQSVRRMATFFIWFWPFVAFVFLFLKNGYEKPAAWFVTLLCLGFSYMFVYGKRKITLRFQKFQDAEREYLQQREVLLGQLAQESEADGA